MQVGQGTKRFLGSVMKFTSAGCRVVFDDEAGPGGYIEHKESGQVMPIRKRITTL